MKIKLSYIGVFALFILPNIALGSNYIYGGNTTFIESEPVLSQGQVLPNPTPNTINDINIVSPINLSKIKDVFTSDTKKEETTKEVTKNTTKTETTNDTTVRNSDGTFAYGYVNSSNKEYTYANTNTKRSNLSASAINSGIRLPNTFWGWMLVLFLISIIVAIVLSFRNRRYTRTTSYAS